MPAKGDVEKELRHALNEIEAIFKASPDLYFRLDRNGTILDYKAGRFSDLYVPPQDFLGKSIYNVLPATVSQRIREAISETINKNSLTTVDYSLPSSTSELYFEARLFPLLENELVAIVRNTTERQQAVVQREQLLAEVSRQAEESHRWAAQLNAIISSIPDGVVIFGPHGEMIRLNKEASRWVHYSEEVRASPVSERAKIWPMFNAEGEPLSLEASPPWRAIHGETVYGEVIKQRQDSGQMVWLIMSAAPIRGSDGTIQGAVSTATDITKMHDLQQQREDLLHMVSHDLRNPLSTILLQGQVLQRTLGKIGPDEQASAGRIVAAARRMENMIRDLVDAAKLESGQHQLQKKMIPLRPFILELLAHSTGTIDQQRLSVNVPANLHVYADPFALERIFLNLIINALKYSALDQPVTIQATESDPAIVVTVSDRGPGIASEDLPHVFDRFWRARNTEHAEGLGLGLYITSQLIAAHGERIWITSAKDQGSSFHFTLARTH